MSMGRSLPSARPAAIPAFNWAAERTFVWVDDEITGADQDWVAGHYAGDALLHRVDAARGLVAADFAALAAWLLG
jgi:hypothetical protein